ncbi:MAG: hypothetical protein ACK5NG_08420 [Chthoniobacterales bacterium]
MKPPEMDADVCQCQVQAFLKAIRMRGKVPVSLIDGACHPLLQSDLQK